MVQKSGQPPWDVKTTNRIFSISTGAGFFHSFLGSMHPSVAPHFLLVTIGLGLKVFMLNNFVPLKGNPLITPPKSKVLDDEKFSAKKKMSSFGENLWFF